MAVIDLRGDNPLRDLTAALIRDRGRTDTSKPLGIYYLSGDDDFAALARVVEREVFLAWFGNDEQTMDAEYDPYDATSDFVLCVDHHACEPAGTLRVIRPSAVGLKTLHDLQAEPRWGVDPETVIAHHPCPSGLDGTYDVATLAVRPGWTGGAGLHVSHALYCGLYRWAVAVGAEQFVTMLDMTPYSLIDALGIVIRPLCGLEPLEYLGSPATIPALISTIDNVAEMRTNAGLRDLLGGAAALERFSMPAISLSGAWADVEGVPAVDAEPTTIQLD